MADSWTQLLLIETVILRVIHGMCLPGRSTDVLDRAGIVVGEDVLNFLERLTRGFWEQEVGVNEHGNTEDPEENVDFPLDVFESWWNEVGERKVEGCWT